MIPHVESTEIVAQINTLLEVLNDRGHGIRDYENTEYTIDRVEYVKDEDRFYCFFKQEDGDDK